MLYKHSNTLLLPAGFERSLGLSFFLVYDCYVAFIYDYSLIFGENKRLNFDRFIILRGKLSSIS